MLKETNNEEHNIPKIWKANIKKSKKYLNWTPEYFIEDGLKKQINDLEIICIYINNLRRSKI